MITATMDRNELFQQAVNETRLLLRKYADAGRANALVSPEVAAWLNGPAPGTSISTTAPAPAATETAQAFESGFVHEAPKLRAPEAPQADEAAAAKLKKTPVAPAPPPRLDKLGQDQLDALAALEKEVAGCTKCDLCKTRTQTVFSDGTPHADLVFVGEAPGENEDLQGKPFVGKAGELLTDIIVKGLQLRREDVYICNVLKCRPPNNRDPLPHEKQVCEPYLVRQLDLVRPKVICALGAHAAKTLLKSDESTTRLRGKWHFYHGIPLRVTYHPAYLLRSPGEKRKTWDDIQEIMKVLRGEVNPQPESPRQVPAQPMPPDPMSLF